MQKRIVRYLTLAIALLAWAGDGAAQSGKFIPVEGPSLKSKTEEAVRQGRLARSRFWAAYGFDVRPGVSVDVEYTNQGGQTFISGGVTYTGSGVGETRNVGVFLLYEADGAKPSRLEVYNLDRRRNYDGYPVYWMGKVSDVESLGLLKDLVESRQESKIVGNAVTAVALHESAQVSSTLEGFIRNSPVEKVRDSSVFWLGQTAGNHPLLPELVQNEQENTQIRRSAVFSIAINRDATSLPTLQSLYETVKNREVKRHIIFGAFTTRDAEAGVNFLIKIAESDSDQELRKQALFWLGQKAGERSAQVLGRVIEDHNEDTGIQEDAVFAISRRPREEAVPMLMNIAKTHQKAAVRRAAIFWLGQSGDKRALELYKELLGK